MVINISAHNNGGLFGVLGSRCLLDCHVLKGFGIYMIGILGSLSDVVGGFS